MIFTAKMKFLTAVVLAKYSEAVTKELLRLGLLHFVKLSELKGDLEKRLTQVIPEVPAARYTELRRRVESFLASIKCQPQQEQGLSLKNFNHIKIEIEEKKIDELASEMEAVRERQKIIQQEILKLEDIAQQVELFGDVKASLQARSHYSFLSFRTGQVKTEALSGLKKEVEAFPSVVLTFHEEAGESFLLIITMKRDEAAIAAILDKYAFRPVELPQELSGIKGEVLTNIQAKKECLLKEQSRLAADSLKLIQQKKEELLRLWEKLKLNELASRINSFYNKTSRTILFSGWIPERWQKTVSAALKEVTEGSCYIEWLDPEGVEEEVNHPVKVPVKLQNAKALSPFQMLVTNYSTPAYGTLDPTPIVAVLYMAMFGLMFADVGQGLVILILGLTGGLWGRYFKRGAREIIKLFSFCGLAAIGGGILFGSYFGFEILPPLWFNFHSLVAGHVPATSPVKSILEVLVITLYFGIGIIVLGLVLNWINLIKQKKWLKLIFERTGLVGGWFYAGGIYTGYSFVASGFKNLPQANELLLLVGIPALLLFGKPIVEYIEQRAHGTQKPFSIFTPFKFFFEWLLELLEVFISYLSNTLSFMRVAGLGIAHVALMMAFMEVAKMFSCPGGEFGFLSWVIIVIGNIFVIALEGLSAGIQSLRLNYYEFFSKYFYGSGETYMPVSLKEAS